MPLVASRSVANRLRLVRRLAAGMSAKRAAAAEGLPAEEIDSLLADPAFTGLVESCRHLDALPEDEAVERLVKLAYHVIEDALNRGHVMVGFYVIREHERGRNPACSLARSARLRTRRTALRVPPRPACVQPCSTRPSPMRRHPPRPRPRSRPGLIVQPVTRCPAPPSAPNRQPTPLSRPPPQAA
jgi:hypothetical protein